MKIHTFAVGPMGVNCTILDDEKGAALIFDPGEDFEALSSFLDEHKMTSIKIYNTHGHFDHVGAVEQLRQKYNAPFYISKEDEMLVGLASQTATMYGLPPVQIPQIDGYVKDGDIVSFSGTEIQVIATPGHSLGGVCYLVKSEKVLIAGDTLFKDSIGRTDFPYADHNALLNNIRTKLFTLDDDIQVITGHGEFTTIGYEKKHNPFVR